MNYLFSRSETPTINMQLGKLFTIADIDALDVTFKQEGEIKVIKELTDCTLSNSADETVVSVALSQDETMLFKGDATVEVQTRIGVDGTVVATYVSSAMVGPILQEQPLYQDATGGGQTDTEGGISI